MPSEPNFFEGEVVEYRGRKGTICFVDPQYISLCVSETVQEENIHKSCQCRVVIYPEHWHDLCTFWFWTVSDTQREI